MTTSTRISDKQLQQSTLFDITRNRLMVDDLRAQVASGRRVSNPGDDAGAAGTISQMSLQINRNAEHGKRIENVRSVLAFQDNVLNQSNNILVRAKEIATQAANETYDEDLRAQLAEEVWQLRDHLVNLGNSQYQGRFIYGGFDDDDPPYDATTYTNPSSGNAHQRYIFDSEAGSTSSKTVNISDSLTITATTPGNQIFDEGIFALERLGRSLQGYSSTVTTGTQPDGGGNAYSFPADYDQQTADIKTAIDLVDRARTAYISPAQASIAGRMARLDSAQDLLETTDLNAQQVLDGLQNLDAFEGVSRLSQAQTALEASLAVTARIMNTSVLQYI